MRALNILIPIIIFVSACKNEPKQTDTKQFDKIENEKTTKLDTLYSELYNNEAFNGNVLVAENGNIIFEKSFGLANEETGKQLNPQTVFELASVSKQFTAMGIVQLEKQGKLSYSDTITKYIPELSNYKGITIKNLLTHTGGLPDYMQLTETKWDQTKIATNDDIIRLFEDLNPKIQFEPNEKWAYSNTGYLVLATIIERVSGKSFGDYLTETIFEPLDMNHTFVYRRHFKPENKENYAEGYFYSDSLKQKVRPEEFGKDFYTVYLDGIVGDGMVNSNLEDLLKWDRALYQDEIINDRDRELIFSSYKTKGSTQTDYGFGWAIDSNKVYGKIISHSGSWAGYISYIDRHIDNNKTIIMLQNNATPITKMPLKNTRRILYGLPVEKPIKLDSSVLKSYAGIYIDKDGDEKEIILKDDKLFYLFKSNIELELIPVSKTKFIIDGFRPEVSYTFSLDKNGDVLKYRVQQPEQDVDEEAFRKK